LVEQRTENPRVGGSIPPLGTILKILPVFSIRYRAILSRHEILDSATSSKHHLGETAAA
jgi:hypothetical protein